MFSNPQRLVRRNAARRALFGRSTWIDLHNVTRVFLPVMFKDSDEVTPPHLGLVPRVLWGFEYPFHVEVFDEHGVVLCGVAVRKLVFEIVFLFDIRA